MKARLLRSLIPISFVIALLAILGGLKIDASGFAGNLLAETAGIFISIILALVIVDRYVEYQKWEQWSKVRNITYMALAYNLCKIFGSAVFSFESEHGEDELKLVNQVIKPGDETLEAMNVILSRVRGIEGEVLEGNGNDAEHKAETFYESLRRFDELIQPEVSQVRNILIPRLLLYSKDQKMIDLLVAFDQLTHSGHDTVEQLFIMMTEGVSAEIIHRWFGDWTSKLLGATRDTYKELASVWEGQSQS
jgi:hypothetical protein